MNGVIGGQWTVRVLRSHSQLLRVGDAGRATRPDGTVGHTQATDTVDRQPPSGARAEAKQQAIIEAARASFLAEGFDASMDRIAAADVSKATVYNHFGSKEALFTAVVGDELDRALAEPVQLVESRLATSTHLYDDMVHACRLWVAGIATPRMIALRNLVTGEARRGRHARGNGIEAGDSLVASTRSSANPAGDLVVAQCTRDRRRCRVWCIRSARWRRACQPAHRPA